MKYTKQVEKTLSDSKCDLLADCEGLHIKGYEIHQGITHGSEKILLWKATTLSLQKIMPLEHTSMESLTTANSPEYF